MDKFRKQTIADIRKYGRACLGVFGDDDDPPFTYTIGNHKKGLPELLIIGRHDLNDVLNYLSEQFAKEGVPPEGAYWMQGAKCPVYLIRATDDRARDHFTVQAGQILGTEGYDLIQVVMPDLNGRFPWESGCTEAYADMPILGATPKGKQH